jgi:hypothetical protein
LFPNFTCFMNVTLFVPAKNNTGHHHRTQQTRCYIILFSLFSFINCLSAYAQNRLSGSIMDKGDNQPVIGAYVFLYDLKDTTSREATTSDVNGRFSFTNLKKKSYRLSIQSINYQKEMQIVAIQKPVTDLGIISLNLESRVLKEVVIVGQGTAVQKGDTTIMTADAFKVNQDANAEDLVKKMPGITVENGTVKARGEDVKQILVDGKPFFGDDPSVALRNLPADVIDRIQVYNKLSDQAELTGFDDGESSRTINIITRRNSKYSKFGKLMAGTDFYNKYLVAGSLNVFSGPRRFTLSGMTNNINQQNFAIQDLISSSGTSGRSNWGGQSFGGSSGISKNSSLGFNYQDNWGKKITVSGSYFYNTSSNTNITRSLTEYNFTSEDGKYAADSSNTSSNDYNHRVNMRIEYKIDTMNSIILVPRFSIQDNSSDKLSSGFITGGSVNSVNFNSVYTDAQGYNAGNDLTWRHKFTKRGRTLSVRSSVNFDKRNSDKTQFAQVNGESDDQYSDISTDNLTINTNLNYTEPINKNSQLQFNFNNRFRRGKNNNEIYALGSSHEQLNRLDSLSSVYDNDYITNRGGISYLYRKNNLNLSAGINYERADLRGQQTFPQQVKVNKLFEKLLPVFMLNYKFSDINNLRIFYRTSTDAPSITELQTAIDNSDRLRISTGNPELKQSYSHNLITNYSYANPTTGFNAFIFLRGSYSTDIMSYKTILAGGDTISNPEGIDVILMPGQQLSYPVNLDHSWQMNTMINLSYFIKPVKSNISLVTGFGYTYSPAYIQQLINDQKSYNLTNSLIITSNISSNVDFTVSYTSNYNKAHNSISTQTNQEYWYQSASAKINLVLWKGITWNTDIVGQYNKTSQGTGPTYKEKYLVWNASLGKKFLKNNAAELKVGIYDILNQNRSFYHTVNASYTRDAWTNAYKRYFMILFTYSLRSGRSQGNSQPQEQQQERRDYPGPPPGMAPGMPSGGYRPGGGYSGGDH